MGFCCVFSCVFASVTIYCEPLKTVTFTDCRTRHRDEGAFVAHLAVIESRVGRLEDVFIERYLTS